jgi:hypothetical protein
MAGHRGVDRTTNQKVTFSMLNCRGYAPGLPDAVNNGDQMVTILFEAHHDSGDASALKITRALARRKCLPFQTVLHLVR